MKLGNLTAKLSLSITAALAMLPALAQAQHSVTFTEQNGVLTEASDLFPTITWTPKGKEQWVDLQLVGQVTSLPLSWEEPVGAEGENSVTLGSAFSDLTDNLLPPPDGTFQQGTVLGATGDKEPASIRWFDLGDPVPDTTNTLPLFGLTCLSLIVLLKSNPSNLWLRV